MITTDIETILSSINSTSKTAIVSDLTAISQAFSGSYTYASQFESINTVEMNPKNGSLIIKMVNGNTYSVSYKG